MDNKTEQDLQKFRINQGQALQKVIIIVQLLLAIIKAVLMVNFNNIQVVVGLNKALPKVVSFNKALVREASYNSLVNWHTLQLYRLGCLLEFVEEVASMVHPVVINIAVNQCHPQ
eukprot:TRINITY_DN250_c0_g1_i6.p4 TRINITY_DN250_c0_g1~~TRINITY_DN250_c0_g1_i6.p4  ORF type:complete len:115 (+),score=9.61 TRINITY_DN250_c0_g1_i6:418-762(+)